MAATTDKIQPAHAINRYLWSRIGNDPQPEDWPSGPNAPLWRPEKILDRKNYSGLVPIVPVEETAEFITVIEAQPGIQSFPYIVYSWSRVNTGQAWFHKAHNIAYSIRSADDDKTGQLLNLFEQEFQSYDTAAIKVNEFIAVNGTAAHKRYNFTFINVQVLGAPMPAESENGVSESLVTINVNYTQL